MKTRRERTILRYHVHQIHIALARAEEILAGPWNIACPDCGAPARQPCFPDCPRFREDPE